ncbi:MAG: hypothetical protein KBS81_07810 [Spirochaetales bacterium]|nr:hypothetical protein [Candidatus Physcosoma equi]
MKKILFLLGLLLLSLPLFAFSYPEFELTLGFSPVSSSFIDFYKGNDIDGARSFMTSPTGGSLSLEMASYYEPGFGVTARGGFSMERKKETVFPKAFNMYYYYFLFGPETRFALNGDASAFFGLEAGLGGVHNANVTNLSEYVGLKGGLHLPLGEHLFFGVESHLLAVLSLTEDPYYCSVALETESLVLDFGWRL